MQADKEGIRAILKALLYLGDDGQKALNEADVHIRDGDVRCRGNNETCDPLGPAFWAGQRTALENIYLEINGYTGPAIIDEAAQVRQDKLDEYNYLLKNKMNLFMHACRCSGWYFVYSSANRSSSAFFGRLKQFDGGSFRSTEGRETTKHR